MSETLPVVQSRPIIQDKSRASYQSAREVEQQARVTKTADTPEFRRALDRLNRVLDEDKPLRDDVPRGYYLNLVI